MRFRIPPFILVTLILVCTLRDVGHLRSLVLEEQGHRPTQTAWMDKPRTAQTKSPVMAPPDVYESLLVGMGPSNSSASIRPEPLVETMINQVESATIFSYNGGLSGEWPVIFGVEPYTITTRHSYSGEPISKTTRYVGRHLADLGLDVKYHQWDDETNPNVIGELTGTNNPADVYLLSAHLDSTSNMPFDHAPGADDNASGSTAVLVAADILSQFQWDCTLRFALWTGEEQGLKGSRAYARRANNEGETIKGVLNLDMIGWNTPGTDPGIDLHANNSITGSLELALMFADVVDAYGLNLIPQVIPNGIGRSDHVSFWESDYPAILGIEDLADFNPYYHTSQDRLQNLDLPYFTEFVKASLATFTHMSDCLVGGVLDGHVAVADGETPIPAADLIIESASWETVFMASDANGYYRSTLPAGVYTVTASAVGYYASSFSDVVIANDTVTTLDFSLDPWPSFYLPLVTSQGDVNFATSGGLEGIW